MPKRPIVASVSSVSAACLLVLGGWLYSCADAKGTVAPAFDADLASGGDVAAADGAGSPPPLGGDAGNCQEPSAAQASVLTHHKNPSRDGLSVDPLLTNPAGLARDMAFDGTLAGSLQVLAQPLYVANVTPGKDAIYVVSEANNIYALDSITGAPNPGWPVNVGTPIPPGTLPCGGGITTYGITATPVIDAARGVLYAESFVMAAGAPAHQVVALSLTTGKPMPGWPVSIDGTTVPGFTPIVEHARGALALVNGVLYVPYSGLNGDCNSSQHVPYHGGIVGIDTAAPTTIKAWFTAASWGGSWGTSGVSSDGTNVYLTTGNTTGANGKWGGGEAVLRFSAGPLFSDQTSDYFAPHDWQDLDNADADLGSSGAILLNVPGATPSSLLFAAGKGGTGYLLSRADMGGIGSGAASDGLAHMPVANGAVATAFAAYTTAKGSYVAFRGAGGGASCPDGTSGELIALAIGATSPPTLKTAWCANANGSGSPMVTMSGCTSNAVVWVAGATGTNRLYGFDGDTGAPVYDGGGANEQMQNLEHWITPMEAKGRIFVAGDGKVYAFQ